MERKVSMQENKKKANENQRKDIKLRLAIGSSALMLLSLFTPGKLYLIGLTIWLISIFNVVFDFLNTSNASISSLWSYSFDRGVDEAKEKHFSNAILYFVALPMCMVGIIMVVVTLVIRFIS